MNIRNADNGSQRRRRNPFFFAYCAVLLAIVLIGFAPSLYLRFAFDQPPLLPYLYLHGAFITGWFVWLVAQAWLINCNKPVLHRQLGYVGAAYGLLVVIGGLMAGLGVVSHDLSQGITFDTTIEAADPDLGSGITYLAFISHEVWISIADLLTFATLLGGAVIFRSRFDIHKRLVLLAALVIVNPALGRLSRLAFFGGEGGPFVDIALLLLLAAILLNDWLSLKKIHKATFSALVVYALLHVAATSVANTDFGERFTRSLGHEQ